MSEQHEFDSETEPPSGEPSPQRHGAPGQIDRRKFFRGAAALTVGGLSATAGLAQQGAPRASNTSSASAERPTRPG